MAFYHRLIPLVTLLVSGAVCAGWTHQARDIMGTRVSLEIWHPQPLVSDQCSKQIFEEFERLDRLLSVYLPDSEVSEVNRNAAKLPVAISHELVTILRRAKDFSELSRGAFDITYASIGYRYNYRDGIRPRAEDIIKDLPHIDFRKVQLVDNTVRFSEPGVRIDLGGIAKGYAVDRAIAIARECNISNGIITAGGDSRILGDKGGRPWVIGIQHPRDSRKIALKVPLEDAAISTSGDYERFFVSNGERIHHIIDPKTGKSANRSWSASVIGPDAMTTDALSTTLFVMGPETGMALIDSLPEVDAIIIDNQGKVHYSAGLMEPDSSQ